MRKIYRKKRWLAAALSLCLGISLLPAAAAAETVSVSSLPVAGAAFDDTWKKLDANLLNTLKKTEGTSTEYESLPAGKYYLAGDLEPEYTIKIKNVDVTLDLNGHVLQADGKRRAISVECNDGKEISFTLQDSNPTVTNTLDASSDSWKIADDKTPENKRRTVSGGVITGGSDREKGGGLEISGANGTLTARMTGGSIAGCWAAQGGGGVYVFGEHMTFEMSGGAIFGNSIFSGGGAALRVYEQAKFTMSGGRIESDVKAMSGVEIRNASMTQTNGEIQGAICVKTSDDNKLATFTAEGGTIRGDIDTQGSNATCTIAPQVQQSGSVSYTVSFQVVAPNGKSGLNGFQAPQEQKVQKGECAKDTGGPSSTEGNTSCTFSHWYLDDLKVPYDFTAPVTKSIVLTAHMHDNASWQQSTTASALVKAGTCTSAAIYSNFACKYCGKGNPSAATSPGAIDPSNHGGPFGDWQSNETEHWRICSACQVEVGRETHNYVNGTCSVCRAAEPTAPAPAPAPAPTPGSSGGSSSGSYTPAPTPQPTRPTPTVTVDQMGDVPKNVYFYEAVKWAAEMGITQGAADGSFKPYQSCSKNQLVTFLWRAAGCPKPSGADADTDGAYYSEAVKWAAEAGIFDAKGNAAGGSAKFSRQQVASIVYRFAKALGYDLTQGDEKLMLSYNADEMTTEDLTAFRWACSNGILQPADGYLMPDGTVNRSQLIAMLYRLMAEKTDQ